jgi:quercetin dioxygenase-like cupin family protein
MTTTIVCRPGEVSNVLNRLPQLGQPLLQFNLLQEIQALRQEDSWERETGRSSKTLAKYPDFRIVLILMKADTKMDQHRAEGRVSIHQMLGKICVHLPDQDVTVSAGDLLVLDCGVLHNLEALEESAFLLTISWDKGRIENASSPASSAEGQMEEEARLRMDDEGGSLINASEPAVKVVLDS